MADDSSNEKTTSRARTWFKRVVLGLLVLANVAVAFVYWQLRTIETTIDEVAETDDEVVVELEPVSEDPVEPLTFLVIGSDSREGLDDLTDIGDFAGERADVVMLMRIFPENGSARILSIPRDLWVNIPGFGEDRINAAYALGGAPLTVRTIREDLGINVNHYMKVDFVGFQSIVDQLGGIAIDFDYPARDLKSGLDVEAGRQLLDGDQALAYARSRQYQELRDGSWTSIDANDIGRTGRQQELIIAILSQVAAPSNLTETGAIVGSFAEHLTIDGQLAEGSLVSLAFRLRNVRPGSIETATLPVDFAMIGEKSVVVRTEPEATAMIQTFLNEAPDGTVDSEPELIPLAVAVLNGNGISGSAAEWSQILLSEGYVVTGVGDADAKDYETTVVLVPSGEESNGDRIVRSLGFGTVQVGETNGADAVVILGTDVEEMTG